MKSRILFVDDEPFILSGLRRMLRRYSSRTDTEFVGSGKEALEQLRSSHYTAIVSDMRMPGMDGRTLLDHVAQDHPNIARFILSGQSDRDDILGVVRTAHQFLAKPCDVDGLERVLKCAEAVIDLGCKERALVHRRLPSPKARVDALHAAVAADTPNVDAISEIVQSDIAMTGQILRLVNSGFFGRAVRTLNCSKALVSLGATNIKSLVETVDLFRPVEPFSQDGDAAVEQVNAAAQAAASECFVAEAQTKIRLKFIGALAACEAELDGERAAQEQLSAHILALWGLAPDFARQPQAFA